MDLSQECFKTLISVWNCAEAVCCVLVCLCGKIYGAPDMTFVKKKKKC